MWVDYFGFKLVEFCEAWSTMIYYIKNGDHAPLTPQEKTISHKRKGILDKNSHPDGRILRKGSPRGPTDRQRKEKHAGKGKCCFKYSKMVETGSRTTFSGAVRCYQSSISWWGPCWPIHKSLNGKC